MPCCCQQAWRSPMLRKTSPTTSLQVRPSLLALMFLRLLRHTAALSALCVRQHMAEISSPVLRIHSSCAALLKTLACCAGFFLFAVQPFKLGDRVAVSYSTPASGGRAPWFEGVCEKVDLRCMPAVCFLSLLPHHFLSLWRCLSFHGNCKLER